jgi:hypothetical protein
MRQILLAGIGATALLLCMIMPARAQHDHYTCYKVKDAAKVFRRATADLTPFQSPFATQGCAIKARAKRVCVPSSKTVTAMVEGDDAPFPAQELFNLQVCYKIKCERPELAPIEVSDQFGTRSVAKFKASRLCVPAVVE